MKVLFIQPPSWHSTGIHYNINRPLAGPVLATILSRAGHDARFIDAECLQWMPDQVGSLVRKEIPDIVAFTILYHNRQAVAEAVKIVREVKQNMRIIAGGPYATSNPDDCLLMGIDQVCRGEGEAVIKGMLYPDEFPVVSGIGLPLDAVGVPNYSLCEPGFRFYNGNAPRIGWPEAVMLWARGCPHRCNFCSNPVFGRQRVRTMSEGKVIAELEELKKCGIKVIFVYSDELVGSSRNLDIWLAGVCREIAARNMNLLLKTQGRCSGDIKLETLEAMYQAGFRVIMWGIESLSQRVLDNLDKDLRVEEIWHTLRLAKQAGIKSYGFFMSSAVDEQEKDLQQTVRGIREMKKEGLLEWIQVSVFTLEPGAGLYQRAANEGWLPQIAPKISHFEPYLNLPWSDKQEQTRRKGLMLKAWEEA